MSRLSEDDLIERYFAPLAGPDGLALRDDAAVMRPAPGREIVLTQDALVAGVHFFADDPPASIAAKALGVNLSDLAAKASRPLGFLLALALPPSWTEAWLADFSAGLGETASLHECPLIGGDTVATPGPLTIAITALGEVAEGAMLRRTGAQVGDRIYVSGTIGDSALGLRLRREPGAARGMVLTQAQAGQLLDRYLHPRPRLVLREALGLATGGMDVSDGLVGDLAKMLRVSGVSGRVELDRIPLSDAARTAIMAEPGLFEAAVTGGDDYEVLASVPPDRAAAFEAAATRAGVQVTAIGVTTSGFDAPQFVDSAGRPRGFARGSYRHS